MTAVLGQDAPRRLEHHRDRRLVVAAEDRRLCVPHDAVLHDRLDRVDWRHRVEVRAEEHALARRGRLEAGEDVAGGRAHARAGVVLVGLEAAVAQVADDAVGDRPLLARRARHSRQLEEEFQHLRHGGAG